MTSFVNVEKQIYCIPPASLSDYIQLSYTKEKTADITTMSQPQEEVQRPAVSREELAETKNRLGEGGPAKSKTFEVMEECERMGKTAPSVFSGVRSGGETALNTRSARPAGK
ncbi:musculoskeletal embryonic nuclear protein 1a isoform X2 [Hippocampus comes]|uniref:musculoskeletal embryonic nuclear protein 1a isoform X2 n=1 Tax=Hippocampus comes TaxID=109280 RepID=UPI00094E74E3|nr:PREDICTED: musculoskeletal embryonic nuclear protein 1-like isoform X2 [Hippocampus comes]